MKTKNIKLYETEKTINTIFVGNDEIEYEAKVTLTVEEDGLYYVSTYNYYDPEKEEWINTEERGNWSQEEIEKEFEIEL